MLFVYALGLSIPFVLAALYGKSQNDKITRLYANTVIESIEAFENELPELEREWTDSVKVFLNNDLQDLTRDKIRNDLISSLKLNIDEGAFSNRYLRERIYDAINS